MGGPNSDRAVSRLSIAMLTPAQKPRGLARMIFTLSLRGVRLSYRGAPDAANRPPGNANAPGDRTGGVGTRSRAGHLSSSFTLLTVTIFLPSFSDTVPVTSPSFGEVQMLLWLSLCPLSSK